MGRLKVGGMVIATEFGRRAIIGEISDINNGIYYVIARIRLNSNKFEVGASYFFYQEDLAALPTLAKLIYD